MAKSDSSQQAAARKRVAKESRMNKADGKGKSKYAEKLALKMGSGKRRIGWMWWTEGDSPRDIAA
jgi:hypothetical protein